MNTKRRVAVSRCWHNDQNQWRVRWHVADKPRRKFFPSEDQADSYAAKLRGHAVVERSRFDGDLSDGDRQKLEMVRSEATRRGVDILTFLTAAPPPENIAHPIGGVIAEMLAEGKRLGRDEDYLSSLRQICTAFAAAREKTPIEHFTKAQVQAFLDTKPSGSHHTIRSRLSTLFKFNQYHPKNPCVGLKLAAEKKKPIQVFTPAEAEKCVRWLKNFSSSKHTPKRHRATAHRGMGWFLLTAFGGLRPEEAFQCPAGNLHLDAKKPFVEVTPNICKTGQQRIVYILPEVVTALKFAIARGSVFPFGEKGKIKLQRQLRGVLGWKVWKFDVTRHSAASYWHALVNDPKHVVEMLGHTEGTYKKHYKKPVEREIAEAYFTALKIFQSPTVRSK
jgi:hypothetical protein